MGAILAGGAGRRMGGAKAMAVFRGRPLALHVASALDPVCSRVVIVAKADSGLPDGLEVWVEPDEPRHPAAGIAFALERAGGPVLVCAVDMPFVTPAACRALIGAAPAVAVSEEDGRLQPLLGVYEPSMAPAFTAAGREGVPLTRVVEGLGLARVPVPSAVTRSLDTPGDLV